MVTDLFTAVSCSKKILPKVSDAKKAEATKCTRPAATPKKPASKAKQKAPESRCADGTAAEVRRVIIGGYSIAAWYPSPYPDEYKQGGDLYICQRCLKYMRYRHTLEDHRCADPFPRGRPIYEDASTVLHEVDGKEHALYCQNMCLLSKLFLDQKTIYYDIGNFLFYVLLVKSTESIESQYTFAGYFSKEKTSIDRNNLACILVLPPFRGQSYGQLMIEISYELTKIEQTTGGPEQPLSSQGFHSYRSYWRRAIVQTLLGESATAAAHVLRNEYSLKGHSHDWERSQRIFSLSRLALLTGIRIEDVLFTLDDLGLLEFWRGRHIVCIADETLHRVIAEHRINLNLRADPTGMVLGREDCHPVSDSSMELDSNDSDRSSDSGDGD
ncbi:K(lysine) acetyltransferase [Coemansia sp. IMI 209128]|nr:K(lysine) acetyltransferase [Coemansia sp. IMI 209128]